MYLHYLLEDGFTFQNWVFKRSFNQIILNIRNFFINVIIFYKIVVYLRSHFTSQKPEPDINPFLGVADSILEYFLEAAMKDFMVGRVDQTQWHPDYCSPRVVIYILVRKK